MHNMSLMSHLSVDPAALAQVSMMQGHYNINPNTTNMDTSQFATGLGADTQTNQMNEDRMQIVQWHLS